jgi:LysM domain
MAMLTLEVPVHEPPVDAAITRPGATRRTARAAPARRRSVSRPPHAERRGLGPRSGTRLRPARAPARVTGRGSAVLAAGIAALAAGSSLLFGGPAAAPSAPPPARVVVQPGETLWAIAGRLAPTADRRDVVAAFVDLNELATPGAITPGQSLAVPGLR